LPSPQLEHRAPARLAGRAVQAGSGGVREVASDFVWIDLRPGFYTHDHYTGKVHLD
jgi:hypothetical protein